jgi:hypothetical protein
MVGFARTARICASRPSDRDQAAQREVTLTYYRHVAEPPHPTITVIEDVDREPVGTWWGEVHTHVRRGLGAEPGLANHLGPDLPGGPQGAKLPQL